MRADKPKTILFLISDTGGGHRAAATAITQAIHHLYPAKYRTSIHDIWTHETPWPINQMPQLYPWFTKRGRPLWRWLWASMSHKLIHNGLFAAITPLIERRLAGYLQHHQPDLVVSVHPLMNHLGVSMVKRASLDVPFATVITDLITVHPVWFCPEVTCCLVPTDAVQDAAFAHGLSKEQVENCGYPVRLAFIPDSAKAIQRNHPNDCSTIVLVENNHTVAIAHALLKKVPQVHLQIITGHNQALYASLQRMAWPANVQVHGFVDDMAALLRGADLLITKAGPGMINEAIVIAVPMILSSYIPGQEWGNLTYVEEHGVGLYVDQPSEIASVAQQWLLSKNSKNDMLSQMAANARQVAKPYAVFEIAQTLCNLC